MTHKTNLNVTNFKNHKFSFPDTREAHVPFVTPTDFLTPTFFDTLNLIIQISFEGVGVNLEDFQISLGSLF